SASRACSTSAATAPCSSTPFSTSSTRRSTSTPGRTATAARASSSSAAVSTRPRSRPRSAPSTPPRAAEPSRISHVSCSQGARPRAMPGNDGLHRRLTAGRRGTEPSTVLRGHGAGPGPGDRPKRTTVVVRNDHWLLQGVALEETPRDHELLDFVRALAEDQERRVAVEALDDELLRVPVAAVDAHRLERDLLRRLGREELRHAGLEVGSLARILAFGRLEHQEPRRLDPRRHLCELQLDRLVLRDRLAERLALLRVADRLLERPGRDPDRPRRDVHSAELDPAHEVAEALPQACLAADHRVAGHPEPVERELDRLDALVAELAERRPDRQPGQLRRARLLLEDERRDSA